MGAFAIMQVGSEKSGDHSTSAEVDGVIGDMIRGRWHLCRNYEASKRLAELGGSALLCFDGSTSERKGTDHSCGKLNQKDDNWPP